MTIYVVHGSSRDDSWVHSLHTDKEKADSECARINEFYKNQREVPCPFPVDEDGDLIDENLSKEDKEKYNNWWHANYDARQWKDAKVIPYETDKPYTEFISF